MQCISSAYFPAAPEAASDPPSVPPAAAPAPPANPSHTTAACGCHARMAQDAANPSPAPHSDDAAPPPSPILIPAPTAPATTLPSHTHKTAPETPAASTS